MTLVVIEQYVKRARELADNVVVLSYGEGALDPHADEVTLSEIEEAYELTPPLASLRREQPR
jgi:ABC-type branched-subunit amino acid transport system ATPase component